MSFNCFLTNCCFSWIWRSSISQRAASRARISCKSISISIINLHGIKKTPKNDIMTQHTCCFCWRYCLSINAMRSLWVSLSLRNEHSWFSFNFSKNTFSLSSCSASSFSFRALKVLFLLSLGIRSTSCFNNLNSCFWLSRNSFSSLSYNTFRDSN